MPPRPHVPSGPGHPIQGGVAGVRPGHRLRIGVERRVRGIEPVPVGQDVQLVGLHQVRHQPGQGVVVPEPDLVGRDPVVLVHDRRRPEVEQGAKARPGVEITPPVGEVVMGEQQLRGDESRCGESRLPTPG